MMQDEPMIHVLTSPSGPVQSSPFMFCLFILLIVLYKGLLVLCYCFNLNSLEVLMVDIKSKFSLYKHCKGYFSILKTLINEKQI